MRLPPPSPFWALWLLTALLSGCAGGMPATRSADRYGPQLTELQQQQQKFDQRLQRLQDNMILLEARLRDQQQVLDKLRQPAATGKVTPAGQITAPAAAATSPAPEATTGPPQSASKIYLQAFADYAAARYAEAAQGFSRFLQQFPDNDYAGNARYWLAECYLARQQNDRAAAEFRRLAEQHPDSGKAPEALRKLAGILQEQGDEAAAERTRRLLRARYPDSDAARRSLQAP